MMHIVLQTCQEISGKFPSIQLQSLIVSYVKCASFFLIN